MTPAPAEVLVSATAEELADSVARRLVAELVRLQLDGRVPSVALTGGTIADAVHRRVPALPEHRHVDWSRVEFWFGDERFVPAEDANRNARQAREAMLDRLPVDPARVHEMPPADGELGADAAAAAAAYAETLTATLGEHPRLDLLMLGVGPDGHCASLFPRRPEVRAPGLTVAVHDSPKPPPTRISLTLPMLRSADQVWFVAAGAEKAGAVHDGVTGDDPEAVPASGPRGLQRTLWLVDAAASARLGQGPGLG